MALTIPTLTERSRDRYASKKDAIPSRLTEKTAKGHDDKARLETWKREVRTRDRMRCRVCGRKVVVTLALQVDRAECHHIVGRANKALRYDRRNGLLVCPRDHTKLQRGTVRIIALKPTDMFAVDGLPSLNADADLTFI